MRVRQPSAEDRKHDERHQIEQYDSYLEDAHTGVVKSVKLITRQAKPSRMNALKPYTIEESCVSLRWPFSAPCGIERSKLTGDRRKRKAVALAGLNRVSRAAPLQRRIPLRRRRKTPRVRRLGRHCGTVAPRRSLVGAKRRDVGRRHSCRGFKWAGKGEGAALVTTRRQSLARSRPGMRPRLLPHLARYRAACGHRGWRIAGRPARATGDDRLSRRPPAP